MSAGKGGCVYILTNRNNSVLYVGVTSHLFNRVKEHRENKYPNSFTAQYNLDKLVYFELFFTIEEAIAREKQLKGGSRGKKIKLIEKDNPEWIDLWDSIQEF